MTIEDYAFQRLQTIAQMAAMMVGGTMASPRADLQIGFERDYAKAAQDLYDACEAAELERVERSADPITRTEQDEPDEED